MLSRREYITSSLAWGSLLGVQSLLPGWARSANVANSGRLQGLGGTNFVLEVGRTPVSIDGRRGSAITVNGKLPAPLLRWREGDTVTLRVINRLKQDTSIHWHGILLPYQMDGVPGVSFPGISPGETFRYQFAVQQSGTYWYHSHSGLQEAQGHYGPLIIDPAEADPVTYDREYVLVLSDWSFENPHRIFAKLKKRSEDFNYGKRTVGDFFRAARKKGWAKAWQQSMMWNRMRMMQEDVADIGGTTFDYLVNGHGPVDNWTGLFQVGQKIRLRFINASSMTLFNVRIPGLPMTIVQADGMNVQPVETDEFQIGVAETYDAVVRPLQSKAYTVMCESIDRSGYGRATLAPRPGMEAPVPALRKRPLLTMKDMGMAHGGEGMAHGGEGMTHGGEGMAHGGEGMAHGGEGMSHGGEGMAHGGEGMAHGGEMQGMHKKHAATHASSDSGLKVQAHDHPGGPGVASMPMFPRNRLHEPGIGLENVGHRTLSYTALRSLVPNIDRRAPEREMELHLTSNMERYMWSFDGRKYSEVSSPILFYQGERLRLTMVNDTMMPHPIHLHGMFFEVVNGAGDHQPYKHTITVKPAEKLSVDISVDALGDWAFHCHLLYHMHAGMFRVVSVRQAGTEQGGGKENS